jgi:hypothetical protein
VSRVEEIMAKCSEGLQRLARVVSVAGHATTSVVGTSQTLNRASPQPGEPCPFWLMYVTGLRLVPGGDTLSPVFGCALAAGGLWGRGPAGGLS